MEDTTIGRDVPEQCGAEDQAPCADGCEMGLTSVIVLDTNSAIHHGSACVRSLLGYNAW